ncbi:DUF5020 family protein [Paludibacter sp. 221]|uniref:nucleoside-specific channel-forming Tsx family protein n=1 Tax=Paludibacter sp. 221 TaxID=2302939 RepID=UPI0013D3273C|nr:DUF5020 family protein [Paludibacter sp. 221]NDV47514.1 DUF5020 family protein [Paludibacter sp. 221]
MKKIFTLLLCLCGYFAVNAQNIQMHYDFGSLMYDDLGGRPKLTSTVEMFRPDKWGSTFFFVDMDYTANGVQGAYWEIARELKFWNAPISAHVEYNGGLFAITPIGASFNNAYLVGPTYTYNNADFTKGFSVSAMYKYIQKHSTPHNFQLTGTWYLHFAQQKLSFTGFVDFWKEKTGAGDFIFLTEPQFWVNLNKFDFANDNFNLSVGTEVEISNNFGGRNGFYCVPTLALKWAF